MMPHQQAAVEQCRDECRAFLDNLKAIPAVSVAAASVEECERGASVEVMFHVALQVAE